MNKINYSIFFAIALLFNSVSAQAENESLFEWVRKKNDDYLATTGKIIMDIDMKCSSSTFFSFYDAEIIDGKLLGPRYDLDISKTSKNWLQIKGKMRFEGYLSEDLWFSGPITNGQYILTGKWYDLDNCKITGSIENDEKLQFK